jgi:hypothetical protein
MATVLLRCSDGHLFTANPVKLVFLSVHLAGSGYLRCPVDHKWRIAEKVSVNQFTEAEVEQATRYRF